ncbi:MAG: helix-turn-helix domain-containing protein [Acidimicrobiales bacterium]
MNAAELATLTADPIQTLGMSFYFDPPTGERAKEHGLNVYEFYGLGRAGTMGDVDTVAVYEAFTFFNQATIDFLWTRAKSKADPVTTAADYLLAAYAFADRTFGDVDLTVLAKFASAARKVVDAQPRGVCPLVDGYKKFPAPADPVHAAYLGTIFLRELRGGVHIHAVSEVGLTPLVACFLQDPDVFTLHGYQADEAPVVTAELEEKKDQAEALTGVAMQKCFDVLSDVEREALAAGTLAMFGALHDPVPVTR